MGCQLCTALNTMRRSARLLIVAPCMDGRARNRVVSLASCGMPQLRRYGGHANAQEDRYGPLDTEGGIGVKRDCVVSVMAAWIFLPNEVDKRDDFRLTIDTPKPSLR